MANPITQIILTAVDRTKAAFGSVRTGLASIGESARSINGMLAGLGAGLSLLKFISTVKEATDQMDEAAKSAQAVGTSVENFSALTFAAEQSGVSVGELQAGLGRLARTLDDAKTGSKIAADAFERLRIDPKDFTDPADALKVIADRFNQMPDGVNKSALAMQIFGKAGAKLIPLLNEGAAGIEALTAEADRLGLVFGTEAAASAEKFNDTLNRLGKISTGLGITIASKLMPSLNQYLGAMEEILRNGTALEKLAFFSTGFISEDVLNRISKAGDRVQDYNEQIFKLQQQLIELRRVEQKDSPTLKIWEGKIKDLEKTRAALIEQAKKDRDAANNIGNSDALGANVEEYKKATDEKIKDTERLTSAIQSAWQSQLQIEKDYRAQAKKLRDEANGKTADGSVEGQSISKIDALAAAMKLQRTAGTDTLENVQANAEALRQLSAQLDDAALKADLLKQANLAEAAALEAAANQAAATAQGLNEQGREAERRAANMKGALEGIGKEVLVDITTLPSVDKTKQDLTEIVHLLDLIKANGPINANVAVPGSAQTVASLRTEALKYGSR